MEDSLYAFDFARCLIGVILYSFVIGAILSTILCVFLKYKKALIFAVSFFLVEMLVLIFMGSTTAYDHIGYDPLDWNMNENYYAYPFFKGARVPLKETDLQLPQIDRVESYVTYEGNNMRGVDNRYENYENIVFYNVTFKQNFSKELTAVLEMLSENDGHWNKKTTFWGHDYYDYSNGAEHDDWCITHVEMHPNDNLAYVIHYIKNGCGYRAFIGTPEIIIIFMLNALICLGILLFRGVLLVCRHYCKRRRI